MKKKQVSVSDAARALGRLGGLANSPAQQAHRHSPKPYAGRKKKASSQAEAIADAVWNTPSKHDEHVAFADAEMARLKRRKRWLK